MRLSNTIKSIAIGSFDGIHLAHQTLIDQAEALVIIERGKGYLTSGYRRSFHTDKYCFFYHFDKIKGLSPQAFLAKLKEDFPALETIVVGYDFHFGKDKSGDAKKLKGLCDKNIVIIDEVCWEEIPVHSRTIRAYLREGNIAMANRLLGREYLISGAVIRGQGLGKKSLVPTLNLDVKEYKLPAEGVYATRTLIGEIWRDSVSFLGHRVSTDGSFAVETHILDIEISQTPTQVSLIFVDFLRPNQKFEGLEALKVQIEADIQLAKEVLR